MKLGNFAHLTITAKLKRLQALTVGLALVFTLIFSSIAEILEERVKMLADTQSTADIISFNASASLIFNETNTAQLILQALHSKPTIVAAQIYAQDGLPFVRYSAAGQNVALPVNLADAQDQLQHNRLFSRTYKIIHPIILNQETLGHLYLLIDLDPMWLGIAWSLGRISLVLLVAFLLSTIYGKHLAGLISRPLINLSKLAQEVSITHNYALRASRSDNDEIGQLIESFNHMISMVEKHENELEKYSELLECEVEIRTSELRKAFTQAQAASVAKSEFLSSMSHELRTPLNIILGYAQLLNMSSTSELSDEFKEYVRDIEAAGRHLLSLVSDLMDLARIEAGKMELSLEEVLIGPIIADTLSMMAPLAGKNNITIINHIDEQETVAVCADYFRLRQILLNLISNAIKYNRPDGSVTIAARINDAKFRISIRDTGAGIPTDKQSRIFNAFDRLGMECGTVEGTGIGLVITKRIVDAMFGAIGFDSNMGEGSEFWVELPLFKSDPMTPRAAATGPKRRNPLLLQHDIKEAHLLLAEDNPLTQRLIVSFLTKLGFSVDVAADGHKAVKALETGTYDLVLMDCQMPVMNGYEAATYIRRKEINQYNRRLPIIAITANAMAGDREKCFAAGMDDYLSKPIDIEQLREKLLFWLKQP